MGVGMLVVGGALRAVLAAVGVDYSMARFPALVIVEMAVDMSLGMAAWMRHRRHRWPSILEMSAAMLVPAIVVLPLVWLGALAAGTAMLLEHVAMFLLMLAVMLRRREEYAAVHAHGGRLVRSPGRARLRRLGSRGLLLLVVFLLVPAVVYTASSTSYEEHRYAPPATTTAAQAVAAASAPAHDPTKPTAVVVIGTSGANVADALVPYEVLANTGAFNVYTVAPERRPLPLLGGLDLVPDLSFPQLRQQLDGAAPDVTVVPEMPSSDAADAAVAGWLRDTASDGLLLGVCTGSRLLAEAGLLNGRPATTHWYRLDGLQQRYPAVNWQRGVRYIDDGDVITTGGLLSSVDGSLRVVERLVGTDAAAAAAQTIGWRHYSPGTAAPLTVSQLAPSDAVVHLLNLGFRSSTTTVGVLLTDGVGELELAAAIDPYLEVKAARTLAISADGDDIRSRHGLTFVPRADLTAADGVDRLLIPGRDLPPDLDSDLTVVRAAGIPVDHLHRRPGSAFEGTLQEMARTMDVPTARWAAKILEYPAGDLELSGPQRPWALASHPFLLGLIGLAVALGAARLAKGERRRRSPTAAGRVAHSAGPADPRRRGRSAHRSSTPQAQISQTAQRQS